MTDCPQRESFVAYFNETFNTPNAWSVTTTGKMHRFGSMFVNNQENGIKSWKKKSVKMSKPCVCRCLCVCEKISLKSEFVMLLSAVWVQKVNVTENPTDNWLNELCDIWGHSFKTVRIKACESELTSIENKNNKTFKCECSWFSIHRNYSFMNWLELLLLLYWLCLLQPFWWHTSWCNL